MDNPTDDRDKGIDPASPPGELEEALKWLEELTARQGKPAELSNPVPATLDSPFRGLIDNEDGDLPDWLKEVRVPSSDQGLDEGEPESRLDWLAKMAQRESIEELPTLEWRRLSEPVQSAILTDSKRENLPPAGESISTEIDSTVTAPEEQVSEEPPEAKIEPAHVMVEGTADLPSTETPFAEPEANVGQMTTGNLDDFITGTFSAEADIAPVHHDIDDSSYGADEFLPPIDDLDAAMAWIEELAVSQETPIEDLPSVADRALASKLMAEAGLSPSFSPLDEFGSDPSLLDSLTPTHPFIEEEDFADTVVLVETLTADQRAETSPDIIPSTGNDAEPEALGHITPFNDAPPEPSFEEAMAFLDELALPGTGEPSTDRAVDDAPLLAVAMTIDQIDAPSAETVSSYERMETHAETLIVEESAGMSDPDISELTGHLPGESPAAGPTAEFEEIEASGKDIPPADDFTPWIDHSYESLNQTPDVTYTQAESGNLPELVVLNDHELSELEVALLSLDALALPSGKSLREIDTTLQTTRVATRRDVNTALDWLEAALSSQPTPVGSPALDLDEEGIIDQMPEDPDEVLAWLEHLAGEESARLPDVPTYEQPTMAMTGTLRSEPPVEELAEADLLNMPDDPDEAMAWLESLARGSGQTIDSAQAVVSEPVTAYLPDIPPSPDPTEPIPTAEPPVPDLHAEPFEEMAVEQIDEAPASESLDAVTAEIEIESAELPDFEPLDMPATEGEQETVELPVPESIDVAAAEIKTEPIELPAEFEETTDAIEIAGDLTVSDDKVVEIEEATSEVIPPEPPVSETPVKDALAKSSRSRRKSSAPKAVAEPAEREEIIQEPDSPPPSVIEETVELSWIDLLKPLQ